MALKTTETPQEAVTEMARGHHLRSLQIKGILKDTEVKRDRTKSHHLHTEMLHNRIGRKEKSSGHTGEVLV